MERDAVRLRVPFDVLDLASAPEFLRWAAERVRVDAGPHTGRDVMLDLADVEFVMAAGVQALLDLETMIGEHGQSLLVVDPAPIVARVLRICSVADRWGVEP